MSPPPVTLLKTIIHPAKGLNYATNASSVSNAVFVVA